VSETAFCILDNQEDDGRRVRRNRPIRAYLEVVIVDNDQTSAVTRIY
jgi:hypothetical protein